jgi:hypothetical protein
MSYCTHHSHMEANQYVPFNVLNDSFCKWMFLLNISPPHRCTPVCARWCTFIYSSCLYVLLQTPQIYGHFPVCKRWCTFRFSSVTECFITHITVIWMLPRMYMLMYLQTTSVTECFTTKHQSKMEVIQYVHVELPSEYLCFITHITAIWTFSRMYKLMYFQNTCITECFITNITAIWRFSSMYTMYLQTTCVTECFITNIRAISTFSSMYTLMYLQTTCVTDCFITHITATRMFSSM